MDTFFVYPLVLQSVDKYLVNNNNNNNKRFIGLAAIGLKIYCTVIGVSINDD